MKKTLFLAIIFCLLAACRQKKQAYQKLQGNVFGTIFHIQYQDSLHRDFQKNIATRFNQINNSLSTYHQNSLISQLNKGLLKLKIDEHFAEVFHLSKQIHSATDGYFDPTIGKMVNLWGFGSKKTKTIPTKQQVDSLMAYVGFDKVILKSDTLIKQNKNITFDFNATAKGYGVDAIANFLETKGIQNYLVEIGGEIRVKGKNAQHKNWTIGIEEPNVDGTRSLKKRVALTNQTIATSGNYRKFWIDSITGQKIAHTFNPKTGIPAKTDLLSVSVITSTTCAAADAYATAFMAMGYQKAKALVTKMPSLKVFFIYLEKDVLKTYKSPNLILMD